MPISAWVFRAPGTLMTWLLRGSIALSVLPVQVTAPLEQPDTYSVGAAAGEYWSGKKFDICWNWSYCGCWWVRRMP